MVGFQASERNRLRESFAQSLAAWAAKIEAPRGNIWANHYMEGVFHRPPSIVILDAHMHGLLSHKPLICERISAIVDHNQGKSRDRIATLVFRDLRLFLENPGLQPPAGPSLDADALYKRDADFFRSMAELLKSGRESDPRADRDSWMYEQRKSGKTLKEIRCALQKQQTWEPLNSDSAVRQAIDRYAVANGLQSLTKKRSAAE